MTPVAPIQYVSYVIDILFLVYIDYKKDGIGRIGRENALYYSQSSFGLFFMRRQ